MSKYKKPKSIKEKEARFQFWKVFLIGGLLFLATSILSVVAAIKLNRLSLVEEIYLPKTSLQDFLLSFLFLTFFVLVLVAYKKAGKLKAVIYKAFFIIAVLWGGISFFNLYLPTLAAILITGFLIAIWLKLSTIWAQDILIVLGLAGVASFFGLGFTPAIVVVLLMIFSAYDFIAVYKTKHMVAMAKDMIDKKVVLGFIIPKEIKYVRESFKTTRLDNFMIVGGGDVVFPSLLAVSVVPIHPIRAFVIVIFSLIGFFISYWLFASQKKLEKPEPIPALPPIALMTIIGYLVTLLIP